MLTDESVKEIGSESDAVRAVKSVHDKAKVIEVIIGTPDAATSELKFTQGFAGFYQDYLERLNQVAQSIDLAQVEQLIGGLIRARLARKQIFVIGNGGSAATASHMATDFAKRRFQDPLLNFRIISLVDNTALVSATANDEGYDNIFVSQLKTLMNPGDLLVAISSSGNSPNVVKATEWARAHGGETYSMVGFDGGALAKTAQNCIHIKTRKGQYGFHEDICMILNHMISIHIFEQDQKAQAASRNHESSDTTARR